MNEQRKQVVTPEEVQTAFEKAEEAIQEAMQSVLALGRKTDRYATENGLTPFQTASMRQQYGEAAKGLGDALSAVVTMHKDAADRDPRPAPRTGGGGK